MATPVARVHLAVAHAALPALLPTPPKWNMLPLLPTPPCPCVAAAILPKPTLAVAKPGRADADKRWDARKSKSASSTESSASTSSSPRSTSADDDVRSSAAGRGSSSSRKNATSSSSSSATSSLASSSSKLPISRGRASSSAERWDVRKNRGATQAEPQPLNDGESSSTGSNEDIDMEEEEEIVWKPRQAMYAGRPGFAVAAPATSMLPMPTASFLAVRVA